jgi:hypothetical protein
MNRLMRTKGQQIEHHKEQRNGQENQKCTGSVVRYDRCRCTWHGGPHSDAFCGFELTEYLLSYLSAYAAFRAGAFRSSVPTFDLLMSDTACH